MPVLLERLTLRSSVGEETVPGQGSAWHHGELIRGTQGPRHPALIMTWELHR